MMHPPLSHKRKSAFHQIVKQYQKDEKISFKQALIECQVLWNSIWLR